VLRELDRDVAVIHAGTAPEAIAAASYYQGLDLILLDRSLAGTDGISILPRLRDAANGAPVVVISGSARPGDVQRALDAGAASYVPKTAGIQEMLFALRRVLAGDPYLPPTLLASLVPTDNQPTSSQQINLDKLTERQKEVLHLLSQGLSNKGIANRLDLSEGTVKLHVSAIMRALGARNRTEAVLVAEQFG
jgi:DNA-binding NarL/FixJ family response regulator